MTLTKPLPTVLILLLFFASCKNSVVYNNKEHIPQKLMEKILLDVNEAECYSMIALDTLHRAGAKDMDSLAAYYKVIFNHYHITKEEFNQSLDWYKNNPDHLDTIYSNMMATINKWQNPNNKKR